MDIYVFPCVDSSRTRETIVTLSTVLTLSDERRDYFTPQPTGFIYKCKEYKDLMKFWSNPPLYIPNSGTPYGWNWTWRDKSRYTGRIDQTDGISSSSLPLIPSYVPILYRSYCGDPYCMNNARDLNRLMHGVYSNKPYLHDISPVFRSILPSFLPPASNASDTTSVDTHYSHVDAYYALTDRIIENNAHINGWSYMWMRPLERFFADVYITDAIQAREDFEKKYAAVEVNWTRF